MMLLIRMYLHLGDISLEFTKADPIFEPVPRKCQLSAVKQHVFHFKAASTYISSISAGVRRVTSGRINQSMTTAMAPVAAKL
jgi:hypothetical protein